MGNAFLALFASRKFVVVCLATFVVAMLVALGKVPLPDFVATVERLAMVLIAAIGAEDFASKWGTPSTTPSLPNGGAS